MHPMTFKLNLFIWHISILPIAWKCVINIYIIGVFCGVYLSDVCLFEATPMASHFLLLLLDFFWLSILQYLVILQTEPVSGRATLVEENWQKKNSQPRQIYNLSFPPASKICQTYLVLEAHSNSEQVESTCAFHVGSWLLSIFRQLML